MTGSLPPELARLLGGGWAAQRIAEVDWPATSLGDPRGWPASLKTALGLVLHSRFPMFLTWGPERISFHNDAYLAKLGSRLNAIGRRAHEVWPEVWPVVGPIVERAEAGESCWFDKLELTLERDGQDRRTWRAVSCSPVPDDDGSVGGVLWIAHETAEARLQATLDELRLSHERFNLAQEVGGIGSWEWNSLTDEGRVSDTYKQMHGLSGVEGPLKMAQVLAVIHPDDLEGYRSRLAAAKQRAEPSTNDYRVVLPDGSIRWVGAKGRPIFSEDGTRVGALGIVFDLTERKEAEAAGALRRALEAAERERIRADEANRAKSKFLAMISHEVRTPLNVVLGLASVLKPKLADASQAELVGEIESAGGMLLRLLNGALDLSKIESGEAAARPLPVDLRETLQAIAGVWRERVRELGLSLSVAYEGAPEHFRVVADGAKIEQTVINFLSNALKLTPEGEIEIRASARPAVGGEIAVRIAVHDEGPGVPPEFREKVFEPFEQLAEGRAAGGAGLGLAICKANVQALGGQLGVDNKPDRGAVFWFEFEAPRVELAQVAPERPTQPAGRRLKVLAAEDHPGNRRLLSLVLDQLGADVELAQDGAQAVTACAGARYDLVLMDAMMPVMDGVSALTAIRTAAPSPGPRVPVFMLTANVFDEDVARYLAAGADGVLRKPIELPELAGVLDRVREGGLVGAAA